MSGLPDLTELSELTDVEWKCLAASPKTYVKLARLARAKLGVDGAQFSEIFGTKRLLVTRSANIDGPPLTFTDVAIKEESDS